MSDDFFVRRELGYFLFRIKDVFVAIRKYITEFVGTALNFSCPSSADVIDRIEGLFRSLVYCKRGGAILASHESPSFFSALAKGMSLEICQSSNA